MRLTARSTNFVTMKASWPGVGIKELAQTFDQPSSVFATSSENLIPHSTKSRIPPTLVIDGEDLSYRLSDAPACSWPAALNQMGTGNPERGPPSSGSSP